jgi:septum formation protein
LRSTVRAKPFPFFDDRIVLASSSPRRRYLLGLVGIRHRVVAPRIREEDHAHEDPVEHVLRLASLKARSVMGRVERGIILGADTVVVADGEILEKPRNRADAERMLRMLAGRWHTVYTGLAVVDAASGTEAAGCERSSVRIRPMTVSEIDAYIATGEPMDKAGSYGIQGYGAAIVEQVRGCYFNVVGLPLVRLLFLVRELKRALDDRSGREADRAPRRRSVARAADRRPSGLRGQRPVARGAARRRVRRSGRTV